MKFFFALILISSTSVYANIELPYHPETDALCFKNGDPELAYAGVPILGELGVKQGICQGMAGVTAAVLENAEFEPAREAPNTGKAVHQLVQSFLENHRHDIQKRVVIGGFKNLREFCEKNKMEVMRAAILYNAEIATKKILPHLPTFLTLKKCPLRGVLDQEFLLTQLRSIEETLKQGHYPLMMYYSHVVMVTGFSETILDSGERLVEISTYDSNHPEVVVADVFLLGMDGLPDLGNFMVWKL